MKIKKIASSLLITGNLLVVPSACGMCSEVKPGSADVGDVQTPNIGIVDVNPAPDSKNGVAADVRKKKKKLGSINEFFCNCGGKLGIGNRKLAKALGWVSVGFTFEVCANLLVSLVKSLLTKRNESKVGSVVDVTTHTTVTINKGNNNQKKIEPVSNSDSSCKNSIASNVAGVSVTVGDEKKEVKDALVSASVGALGDTPKDSSCGDETSSSARKSFSPGFSGRWSSYSSRSGSGFSSRIRGF